MSTADAVFWLLRSSPVSLETERIVLNSPKRFSFIAQSSAGLDALRGRTAPVVVLSAIVALSGACGAQEPAALNANSKCSEYIQRPSDERHDAAVRISSQIEGVSSPGNPMWGLSLDGACGSSPDLTLGEYFR